ncbi:hypothetical protein DFH27DRAFT_214972 [Peziza echinospora]|nr:hypothetical protein DFH27DRAFT_214972 [Peziza echinospora]
MIHALYLCRHCNAVWCSARYICERVGLARMSCLILRHRWLGTPTTNACGHWRDNGAQHQPVRGPARREGLIKLGVHWQDDGRRLFLWRSPAKSTSYRDPEGRRPIPEPPIHSYNHHQVVSSQLQVVAGGVGQFDLWAPAESQHAADGGYQRQSPRWLYDAGKGLQVVDLVVSRPPRAPQTGSLCDQDIQTCSLTLTSSSLLTTTVSSFLTSFLTSIRWPGQ